MGVRHRSGTSRVTQASRPAFGATAEASGMDLLSCRKVTVETRTAGGLGGRSEGRLGGLRYVCVRCTLGAERFCERFNSPSTSMSRTRWAAGHRPHPPSESGILPDNSEVRGVL